MFVQKFDSIFLQNQLQKRLNWSAHCSGECCDVWFCVSFRELL
jgi:hypothetical protein